MNGMMEYKGYHAKIEYSQEDEAFIGNVFGIADTLIFEGRSIEELQTMFHASIDDYLELCQEIGKEPQREYSGLFNVRIPPELHREISMLAQAEGVTLNKAVEQAIRALVQG